MRDIIRNLGVVLLVGATFLFGWSQSSASSRVEKAHSRYAASQAANFEALGLDPGAQIFIRIVKSTPGDDSPGVLEAFVEDRTGEFVLYKRWDICAWSGTLGPKLREGDGQSPEGFYFITRSSLNPYSNYHLSFNLGFPNAHDRANGWTGSFLMVHGNCVSIGCYAMTDDGIEEIYTLITSALDGGQRFIRVHIFPFEMTNENLQRFKDDPNVDFWENLKEGWDWFETFKAPPNVTVVDKGYAFSSIAGFRN